MNDSNPNPVVENTDNFLHRIKADVLLVALGGFAPTVCYPRNGERPYSDDQVRRLREFATEFVAGTAADGGIVKIARALNIPTSSVHVAIWKLRHGKISKYWAAIP